MDIQVKPGMTITLSRPGANAGDAEYLSLAYAVAAIAHEGQINKDGTPYITHPLHLLARWEAYEPDNTRGKLLALLHDVIEDTGITEAILETLGFAKYSLFSGLRHLTRQPDPEHWNIDQREESYHAHIEELAESDDREAVINKIFDLEDNMDISRLTTPLDDWSIRRTVKYHKAWLRLKEVE